VTKPGISLERHAEIGAELAAIADRLVVLATEIRNAYPLASRVSRAAETFGSLTRHDHLLRLRSELEDAMFAQHAAGCVDRVDGSVHAGKILLPIGGVGASHWPGYANLYVGSRRPEHGDRYHRGGGRSH